MTDPRAFGLLGLLILGLAVSCSPSWRYVMSEDSETASAGEAVQNARDFMSNRSNWKIDCSHFVLACYHSGPMNRYLNHRRGNHNLTRDLNTYLTLLKTRRAEVKDIRPGDILIFDKTYDINHDGHIDEKDEMTHVGIVESVDNGLIAYIDASEDRRPPRIHRRRFSFFDDKINEVVARDPATGRKIRARETFRDAFAVQ
jgi:hypothetical protein